jgi:hypothetical protein
MTNATVHVYVQTCMVWRSWVDHNSMGPFPDLPWMVISGGEGDGFISHLTPPNPTQPDPIST